MNREQFNEPINKTPFYAVAERIPPFKKTPYPTSKAVDYSKGKKVAYPTAKMVKYEKGKKVPSPIAKGLIKHKPKRRKLV